MRTNDGRGKGGALSAGTLVRHIQNNASGSKLTVAWALLVEPEAGQMNRANMAPRAERRALAPCRG